MTLTEFLLARIAEDEAEVGHVEKGSWADEGAGPNGVGWADVGANNDVLMARPSRVLAECEAKRRIVEDAKQDMLSAQALDYEFGDHSGRTYDVANSMQDVLKVLATIYADHPDYDEAWRP